MERDKDHHLVPGCCKNCAAWKNPERKYGRQVYSAFHVTLPSGTTVPKGRVWLHPTDNPWEFKLSWTGHHDDLVVDMKWIMEFLHFGSE